MPYAKTDTGIELYYEVYGSGLPVVLVHGNPVDHWIWLYQIPVLAHNFQVIAVDLRAYGRSAQPTQVCSIRDLADDLLAVFTQESVDEAVIGGLSIGGSIVTEFALTYPDKVKGLVLVGTGSSGATIAPFMDKRIQGIREKGLRAYLPEYFPELLSQAFLDSDPGEVLTGMYLANADKLDPAAVIRMYEALKAYEAKDRLAQIKVPTLILAGEHDMARGMCQEINALITGSTMHTLAGGSHACCTDTAREFNEILLSFLESQL